VADGRFSENSDDRAVRAAANRPGSGDFISALQDAVRENPVAAALIGMGALWLFMGGSNTTLFGSGGRKSIFRSGAQYPEQVGGRGQSVSSSLGRVASAGGQTASQVTGVVRQASAAIADAASRAGAQAVDALSSAYSATRDVTSESAGTVAEAAGTAASTLQETGFRWGTTLQQNLTDFFERQPLALGAVGVAVGAGIAASIRTTEAEIKTFGGASDFVREAITEKAADAALQEVKAQGLTPETAQEALRTVSNKVTEAVGGRPSKGQLGGSASKTARSSQTFKET
jgi:hypothetical protein